MIKAFAIGKRYRPYGQGRTAPTAQCNVPTEHCLYKSRGFRNAKTPAFIPGKR